MELTVGTVLLVTLAASFVLAVFGFMSGIRFNRTIDEDKISVFTVIAAIGFAVCGIALFAMGTQEQPAQYLLSFQVSGVGLALFSLFASFGAGAWLCPYQPR